MGNFFESLLKSRLDGENLDTGVFEQIVRNPIDRAMTLSELVRTDYSDEYQRFRTGQEKWEDAFLKHCDMVHPKLRLLRFIKNDNQVLIHPEWSQTRDEDRKRLDKHRILMRKELYDFFNSHSDDYSNDLFELISAWSWYGNCIEFFLNPKYGRHGDGGMDFGVRISEGSHGGEIAFWSDAKNRGRKITKPELVAYKANFDRWVTGDDRPEWLVERLLRTSPEFFRLSCNPAPSRLLICSLSGFNEKAKEYARENFVRTQDGPEVIDRFLTALLSQTEYSQTLSSFVSGLTVDTQSLVEWINTLRGETTLAE